MKPENQVSKLGAIDYVLACTASCLAAYSAGSGLNDPRVAAFFTILAVVASSIAFTVQRFISPKYAVADGFLYAGVALLAFFYRAGLNTLVPGDGFPDQLLLSGWLCWMLVLGSFCMWRDSTVLFQAVPGIAIFGYVGTWDTFRYAPFLFFGFLLCFATLFARAHGRDMMLRARQSGYVSTSLDAHTASGFLQSLRSGPWRWVAGPEWAMLSALLVVAISVVGGPFLQFSLQGVAGNVRLPPPPTAAMARRYFGPVGAGFSGFVARPGEPIGNGPHRDMSGRAIFSAKMPTATYMKMRTFLAYTPHGWEQMESARSGSLRNQNELAINTLTYATASFHQVDFSLTCIEGTYDSIPTPGNIINVVGESVNRFRVDGTVPNDTSIFVPNADRVEGTYGVPNDTPVDARTDIPDLLKYANANDSSIPPDVKQLAQSAIVGAKTDFEKAGAIRQTIASRCTYDLKAPAVPPGLDPVEYFLFKSKRGYCDLFASAMTIMARSVGLPARYVTGFAPFSTSLQDGVFTYHDTDYHAWTEIYYKNVGWQIFDATDGASSAPGAGRGAHIDAAPWYTLPTWQLSITTLSIIILSWLGVVMIRRLQLRVPFLRTRLPLLEKSYADLVRLAELKTGKPRRPSQTPHEYLQAVKPYLNGAYAAFSDATDSFVEVFYGSAEPKPEFIAHFSERIQNAKVALKRMKRPQDVQPEP